MRMLRAELTHERMRRRAQSISAGSSLNLLTNLHGCVARLTSGQGREDDLIDLLIAGYTAHELARIGYEGPDTSADISRAALAVQTAKQRAERIGRYGLTGEELAAVREFIATYDAQLNCDPRPTRGEVMAAQAAVAENINEQIRKELA
jgi:hypothetical protein